MKAVIAIDSLKGSLSSIEAGQAIAEGIRKADAKADVVIRPLADGGEGTVEALVCGMNGTLQYVKVTGPLGEPVVCEYGIIAETKTAVIEMSGAAGITLVPDTKKNPLYATTYGVGEVIRDAIEKGCRRFIVGIDVFFNDNFVNLMSVIKSAVAKYGRPKIFNFDNGSSYKNKQMELLAARIGSVIHYDQPYTPTQKAKIERWFRTMKDQWMSSLDIRDFHSLDELRGNLLAYVQKYNQSVHSSLKGLSPQDRFFSEPDHIRCLSDEEIEKDFLLEIERRVSSDSVIVIDQIEYEVDCRFAKQRIKLRYSPDFEDIFIMESDGTLTPIRLLNKTENAFIKREKIHLCRGEE